MEIKLNKKPKERIGKFEIIREGMGLPPAATRVNELLTISGQLELTFDEIV